MEILGQQQTLPEEIANHLIENQISEVATPLGVASNFEINGMKKIIPMATEEPSVIAAASNGAKYCGNIVATTPQRLMRGQIVLTGQIDFSAIASDIKKKKADITERAKSSYPSIVSRGGGLAEIRTRLFAGVATNYLSVDFLIDTKDAMGANIVNTILEGISELFREWYPTEEILFSILSNYATESLAHAVCEIPVEKLHKDASTAKNIAQKITEAGEFAQLDPYRAATHNKGIMNGIDAVILATGNDTRAVAAAIHAYAARDGQYRGLTSWTIQEEKLVGEITVPLAVATVGGAARVLPKAGISLDMLDVTNAKELAQIIAAVGLAQNFAALRALVTDGIQKGHMGLQARSLALTIGAKGEEIEQVAAYLRTVKPMNQETARNYLMEIRKKS